MQPMLVQICIAVFGLTALAMALTGGDAALRWAPIVGLVGQPFWFIATVPTGQWGMVALCACYSLVYVFGVWKHWIAPAFTWPELEELDEGKPADLRPDADTHNAHVTRDRCVTAKQPAGFVLLPYPATDDMVSAGALALVQAYNLTPEDAARESLAAMVATSPKLAPRPMLHLPVLSQPPKAADVPRCRTERCVFENAIYPCRQCDGRSHFVVQVEEGVAA